MLTGLYPHAHGLTENDGRFGGRPGLDPSDWLVHQPLQDAGYRCGWFGKWHLDQTRSALDYGFEGFSLPDYGYPYSTDAYRRYLVRLGLAPPVATIDMTGESGRAAGTGIALTEEAGWFDFEAGSAVLDGPAETHEAFFLARLAEDWLARLGEAPFFLRVDPWGPHPPYVLAPPFYGSIEESEVDLSPNLDLDFDARPAHHRAYRDYWLRTLGLDREGWRRMVARALAHVALVEAALARVVAALDRLGLAQSTWIFFTADHGDAVGSNGGVGNKGGLMVEETMRVPLLIRGPGTEPGTTCDRLVTNMDIAPTILALCGVDQDWDLHGRSLVELMADPGAAWRNGLMVQHNGLHEPARQRAFYADRWKLVVQEDGFTELYDLQSDPHETRNLAQDERHVAVLEEMRAELAAALDESDDGFRFG